VGDDLLSDALNWLESAVTIARLSHTLKRCSTRVSELIKVFKAYTYMDQSPVQELDVHEGLENTLIVLRHKLKDIVIKRVYNRDLPRITAFGSALNEVWTILLNNAAEALAARSNGTICLRTGQENDYIVVEIADDGPASPPNCSALFSVLHHQNVGRGRFGKSIARRIVVGGIGTIRFRAPATRAFRYLPLNPAERDVVSLKRGLHGKDVIIDERASTLAMCSSNRGRLDSRLKVTIARKPASNSVSQTYPVTRGGENSSRDLVPKCGSPLQVSNQRHLYRRAHQPLKIGAKQGCTVIFTPLAAAPFSRFHWWLTGKRTPACGTR
jgi:hypothetical protein